MLHVNNFVTFRIQKCSAFNNDRSKEIRVITKHNEKLYGHEHLNVRQELSSKRAIEISYTSFLFEKESPEELIISISFDFYVSNIYSCYFFMLFLKLIHEINKIR